jgi:hypothetical protein
MEGFSLSSSAPKALNPLYWNGIPVRQAHNILITHEGLTFNHNICPSQFFTYKDFRERGYALCDHCGEIFFVFETYVAQTAQGAALSAWGRTQPEIKASARSIIQIDYALSANMELLSNLLGVKL